MRRDEAAIDDGRDERERTSFQIVTAADVGAPRHEWYVDGYPFGVKHLTGMTIRWLNLGAPASQAPGPLRSAGEEHVAPLFRVCAGCGKLDTGTRRNSRRRAPALVPAAQRDRRGRARLALSRTLDRGRSWSSCRPSSPSGTGSPCRA